MTINERIASITARLRERGYAPNETPNGCAFLREGQYYSIALDSDDENYARVALTRLDRPELFDETERAALATRAAASVKAVKAVLADQYVHFAVEGFYPSDDEFLARVERAMDCCAYADRLYDDELGEALASPLNLYDF